MRDENLSLSPPRLALWSVQATKNLALRLFSLHLPLHFALGSLFFQFTGMQRQILPNLQIHPINLSEVPPY